MVDEGAKLGARGKYMLREFARPGGNFKKLWISLAFSGVFLVGCGGSLSSLGNTPPAPDNSAELYFVGNFSGIVSGFSAASGHLAPVPKSSVVFYINQLDSAADPDGSFVAAVSSTAAGVSTVQFANVGAGGAMSLAPLSTQVTNPGGIAISSKGVIAVTDLLNADVQLLMYQNNLLSTGPTVATGSFPQSATFSADGKILYVGNNGDGTITVISGANTASPHAVQTATLVHPITEFGAAVVRVRLSNAGDKLAATTLDGRLYLADVSPLDGTLSGITETEVAQGANLEEVIFDPTGQNVYTADQDNGGIYGFAVTGTSTAPLPNSPFSTGNLPGGPTGMSFNLTGDRIYVVMGGQSAVVTFSRDTGSGQISMTNDIVNSGGFLAGRITGAPGH
jgi:DNA-binding beta-propeller fold protein YncE